MRRPVLPLVAICLLATAPGLFAQPLVRVPADVGDLQQAFARVRDGGVIEIAPGVYPSPGNGFRIGNPRKSFTVRSGAGGRAILDGGGSRFVLRLENSNRSLGGLVVFENLIFRHGFSDLDNRAGGVTVQAGEARFVGCDFEDNAADPASTGGGGLAVHSGSTVEVLGGAFTGNRSKNRGGAMAVRESFVTVAGAVFTGNRVNLPGHSPNAPGGAIYVLDGTLHVSDSLFEGNRAGWVGGAIFGFGIWADPVEVPRTEIRITRSTFLDNRAEPDPCCPPPGPTTGGALHAEDQTTMTVSGSRFEGNRARFGGAVDSFRAVVEIDGSVFRDNRDEEPGGNPGLGGALSSFSGDGPADPVNRRPAELTVRRSLFLGRDDGASAAGSGGCLFAAGDTNRLRGAPGVPAQGGLAANRSPVRLEEVAFVRCVAGGGAAPLGGAVATDLVDLVLDRSLVLESRVPDETGGGGGLSVVTESQVAINDTSFAGNRAGLAGGAVRVAASELVVADSRFLDNEVSPGVSEPAAQSLGAAIFSRPFPEAPGPGRPGTVTGEVSRSLFIDNRGLDLREVESPGGPANELRYLDNDFRANDFGGDVFGHNQAAVNGIGASALNALVVPHAGAPATDKGQGNARIFTPPAGGDLLLVPPAGASGSRTPAFLAFAWSGNQARLESPGEVRFAARTSLPERYGLLEADDPGVYALVVNGQEVDTATLEEEPPPPPPGPFLTSAEVPGFRFKVRITPAGGGQPVVGSAEPACIPETLCVSGALAGRSEAFLRVVGPKPNGFLHPTLVKFSTSRVEIWIEQEGTGELQYYVLEAASPGSSSLPGLFDRNGFLPDGAAVAAPALFPRVAPLLQPEGAPPPLPQGPFLSSPAVPGFRFKVRITAPGGGEPRAGNQEPVCIEETLCVSGAVAGRSEVFLRVVGPKPNGFLWPHVVTFSTSRIEVWVEQAATGELQYYVLPSATPGSSDLSGLFDRNGFQP